MARKKKPAKEIQAAKRLASAPGMDWVIALLGYIADLEKRVSELEKEQDK
jgi:hypothetical protein